MKQSSCFLGVLTCAVLTAPAAAQVSPEEALKKFTVADGLQVELFASEPMFVNPTCIDIDHKGRVWVCESVNYRCDLRKAPRNRKEGDRIVVLEDTDADGKADKAHPFYQHPDFIAPLGLAVAPQAHGASLKVYVCHSPHIYLFEDKDGDLKADGPPKVLLTGFRGYDHDHGVHGIHFGPDGKLYFSVGDQGVDGLKSASGAASAPRETKVWKTNHTDCRAGTIWRCDPDGSNLELLAHNFRNQYEPAVDSFGTMFVSDNDDDGNQQTRICYVMYGGNYGYHPRGKGESHWHEEQPGVVHKVLRTGFGSPTGMCWYEGELLRAAFLASGVASAPRANPYGLLLHTDAGPREVRCFFVKTKGAGYELEKLNIVTSTDNWFRPSDVCVAPDGSVFVSDWYDPGVGGHGMGDTTRGRIYRITPKGHKGYKVPEHDLANGTGIANVLRSPNLSARHGAFLAVMQLPNKTGDEATKIEDLFRPMIAATAEPTLRARALHTQAARTHLGINYWLGELLLDKDERFRQLVIRIFKDRHEKLPHTFVSHGQGLHWSNVAKDASPAVAREALLAFRQVDAAQGGAQQTTVKSSIFELARKYDGQDHFYLAAIGIAVGTDPKRREIILADFEKHFPEWNDKVAKLVWELRPPQVIAKLDQKLADLKLTAAQKGQILDILAVSDGNAGEAMLNVLVNNDDPELRARARTNLVAFLPTKWSGLKIVRSQPLRFAIDKLLRHKRELEAIDLIAAAEFEDYAPNLVELLGREDTKPDVIRSAIRALATFKGDIYLEALRKVMKQEAYRKDALQALGKMQTPKALTVLQELVKTADAVDAVEALAGSRPGTIWLLEAHSKKQLPEAVVPEVARLLRNTPYQDLRNKALIAFPAPGKIDPKKLPPLAKLVNRRGDAEHGRAIFARNKDLGCVRCHSLRGTGGNIGPDLSMIGKKASRENLFESILQPDKAIADQYLQWIVETKAGEPILGLLVEETPAHIILRDAQGKDHKILKKEIEERAKSAKSIMPGDLLAYMSEDELVDLVSYLETLKTPALTIDTWYILGPFDNGENDAGLDKEYLPVPQALGTRATIDLAAEFAGKHGRITWKTVKPNAEGYVDLAAFFAPNSSQIVSYLYREIESPADQDATVLLGADDGCKLYVNGELAFSHRRHEAAMPERDKVAMKLKKGANSILLKTNNGDGAHGFYFTIVSEQELKPGERK